MTTFGWVVLAWLAPSAVILVGLGLAVTLEFLVGLRPRIVRGMRSVTHTRRLAGKGAGL